MMGVSTTVMVSALKVYPSQLKAQEAFPPCTCPTYFPVGKLNLAASKTSLVSYPAVSAHMSKPPSSKEIQRKRPCVCVSPGAAKEYGKGTKFTVPSGFACALIVCLRKL